MTDSDSDSDYIPAEKNTEDDSSIPKVNLELVKPVFEEINQIEIKSAKPKPDLQEALSIARQISTKQKEQPKQLTGKFAGEAVNYELGKRPKQSLDQILSEAKKPKNLNSLSKSTLDWERFKTTHKVEDSLEKNRKDGYIARKNFLLASKEKEKDQILSLKRKKLNE